MRRIEVAFHIIIPTYRENPIALCVVGVARRVGAWTRLLARVSCSTSVACCPWTVRSSFAPTAGPSMSNSRGRRQLLPDVFNYQETDKMPRNVKDEKPLCEKGRLFLRPWIYIFWGLILPTHPQREAACSAVLTRISLQGRGAWLRGRGRSSGRYGGKG